VDLQGRSAVRQVARLLLGAAQEPPRLLPIVLCDYLTIGPRRAANTLCEALQDPIEEKLSYMQVPTLVVCGARDPIGLQPRAEAVPHALPRGRLVVIHGAAHAVPYSAPVQLTRAVDAFLTVAQGPDLSPRDERGTPGNGALSARHQKCTPRRLVCYNGPSVGPHQTTNGGRLTMTSAAEICGQAIVEAASTRLHLLEGGTGVLARVA
jgi:hypothetical protein